MPEAPLVGCHASDISSWFRIFYFIAPRTAQAGCEDPPARLHCHYFSQVAKRDGSKVDSLRQGHRCYVLLGRLLQRGDGLADGGAGRLQPEPVLLSDGFGNSVLGSEIA